MKIIEKYTFILLLLALFQLSSCENDKPIITDNVHPELIYGGWDYIGEASLCSEYRMYFFTDGTWSDSICWGEWNEPGCADDFGTGNFWISNDSLFKEIYNIFTYEYDTFKYEIVKLSETRLELDRLDCSRWAFNKLN